MVSKNLSVLKDFSGVFNLLDNFLILHKLASFYIVLSKIYLLKPFMLKFIIELRFQSAIMQLRLYWRLKSRSMHQASNFSNIGQGAITIIVTNRGGLSNRKKGHSRLFNLIRISLLSSNGHTSCTSDPIYLSSIGHTYCTSDPQ